MSLKRAAENEKNGLSITEAEAELYDRQIRLWGLDAQKRLRASCILVIGMNGVGAEICKNLVLSGIKSLTMLDQHSVTEEDLVNQFLIAREDLGKNRAEASSHRARELNPMVQVSADCDDINSKPDTFVKDFDVVIATGCSSDTLSKLNDKCNANKVKFYAADVFGFYGYMFADLGTHRYVMEQKNTVTINASEPKRKKQNNDENETVLVEKFTEFYRFKDAICCKLNDQTPQKILKRTSSVYFVIQVLFRFIEIHGREPKVHSLDQDAKELKRLRDIVMEELKLDKSIIDEEFSSHCIASLSPVCAIVGGVVGQEVIKAVSGRDSPLNNFFLYDGLEGHGMVECFK